MAPGILMYLELDFEMNNYGVLFYYLFPIHFYQKNDFLMLNSWLFYIKKNAGTTTTTYFYISAIRIFDIRKW